MKGSEDLTELRKVFFQGGFVDEEVRVVKVDDSLAQQDLKNFHQMNGPFNGKNHQYHGDQVLKIILGVCEPLCTPAYLQSLVPPCNPTPKFYVLNVEA